MKISYTDVELHCLCGRTTEHRVQTPDDISIGIIQSLRDELEACRMDLEGLQDLNAQLMAKLWQKTADITVLKEENRQLWEGMEDK